MSTRHRSLAGSPQRSATATADAMVEMITETLTPASSVDQDQVAHELGAALPALRSLIAAKHLADDPVVLVADPLRLEIRVVSGTKAIEMSEQLGKVSGAATATSWKLHLPTPTTLQSWIGDTVADLDHVTTDAVPAPTAKSASASTDDLRIDLDVLRTVGGGAK